MRAFVRMVAMRTTRLMPAGNPCLWFSRAEPARNQHRAASRRIETDRIR
jgi:hypothetical protein